MTSTPRSSLLFPEEPLPTSEPRRLQRPARRQLWIALCLPDLALRAVAPESCERPTAVVDVRDKQLGIVAADERAERLGIVPGLGIGAAMAFSDSLELLERSGSAESRLLHELATWSHARLTPLVCLQAQEGLLLEVQGSLRLLGGLDAIKRELTGELDRRRLRFRISTAPTPLAASWLARSASVDVLDPRELRQRLAALPVAVTGWPARAQLLLRQMGIETLDACLRLPRAGFARRLGKAMLEDLDKALGRAPDLRAGFSPDETLQWIVEFRTETSDRRIFAEAVEASLVCLVAELRRRQAQIAELELVFHHLSSIDSAGAGTELLLRFVEPVHEQRRVQDPLLARLERVALPGPAIAVSLRTGPLLPLELDATDLFFRQQGRPGNGVSALALVECLRGRFGIDRVHGIESVADHRPEYAWGRLTERLSGAAPVSPGPFPASVSRPAPESGSGPVSGSAGRADERPLWILPKPVPLGDSLSGTGSVAVAPLARSEAERIESGWWDGHDVRRDYYAVTMPTGERLWVYRDCRTRDWYLHGMFG